VFWFTTSAIAFKLKLSKRLTVVIIYSNHILFFYSKATFVTLNNDKSFDIDIVSQARRMKRGLRQQKKTGSGNMGILIYCIISFFLGFCGFVDALFQPSRAWANAGRSKGLWILITFLGMITVFPGWVTWAVYSYGGTRRAVVRNGGYMRPSQHLRTGGGSRTSTSSGTAGLALPVTKPQKPDPIPCGRCGTTGWLHEPGKQPIACTAGCTRGYFYR
jgi:hypothetical protein